MKKSESAFESAGRSVLHVDIKELGVVDTREKLKAAMLKYSCQTDGDQTVTAEQDFQFKLDELQSCELENPLNYF